MMTFNQSFAKHLILIAAFGAVLSACNDTNTASQTPTPNSTPTAASTASAPLLQAFDVEKMPQSCQQLLAKVEKCVVKYEKDEPQSSLVLRTELEELKAQMMSNDDNKALDEACREINRQNDQIPELSC